MQLNEKQQLAVDRAADWYAKQNAPVFKMAGYAGTGKTTVATTIARTLESDENTLYCAFTGKAACVMRQKGMPGQTIHSAIYDYETVTDPQTGKKHIVHHLKPYLPYKLICATNRNRQTFNAWARKLYGREGLLTEGEKIVRKKNAWDECTFSSLGLLSLVNGMTGQAKNVKDIGQGMALFDFVPECAPDATFKDLGYRKFEYAYTITCHAAQGSEWPYVVVYDDSWADPKNPKFRAAWRYTAATRAKSKLVWVTNR